jgi:signal transduction histidine kinase
VAVQLEAVSTLWSSEPEQSKALLQNSLEITRTGLTETRRAIQSLRASSLDDLGFILALQTMAKSCAEEYHFKLALDLPEESIDLDPRIEHNLYRIAQEALHNIYRHSKATSVVISLVFKENFLLRITDNGLGFSVNPDVFHDHYGIRGMKEYAEEADADFSIEASPGNGTIITFRSRVEK